MGAVEHGGVSVTVHEGGCDGESSRAATVVRSALSRNHRLEHLSTGSEDWAWFAPAHLPRGRKAEKTGLTDVYSYKCAC